MIRYEQLEINYAHTIDWVNNRIVDWKGGGKFLDAGRENVGGISRLYQGDFDASITSPNGEYQFIYKRLNTKGLLLKQGQLIREINRSYYHAERYEYPAAFVEYEGRTYLAHCPNGYSTIDFEDVETGELVTDVPERKHMDMFHSRFEVSPGGRYLLSRGWVWHPSDEICVFDVRAAITDPHKLDRWNAPFTGIEINAANFIDDERILIGASNGEPPRDEDDATFPADHIGVWNLTTREVTGIVPVKAPFGNLFVIDVHRAWDLYQYPKIIHIQSGAIIDALEDVETGKQITSFCYSKAPQIRYNRATKQIAVLRSHEDLLLLSLQPND
jgi:hypothetical protein